MAERSMDLTRSKARRANPRNPRILGRLRQRVWEAEESEEKTKIQASRVSVYENSAARSGDYSVGGRHPSSPRNASPTPLRRERRLLDFGSFPVWDSSIPTEPGPGGYLAPSVYRQLQYGEAQGH